MLNDDIVVESESKLKHRKSKSRTLRIMIIEPRGRYCRTVWCAIGIGLTHIFIGATVMTILLYYFSKGDHHAILCTFAFHFFSAEAIVSLNYSNGWSAPLRLRHRIFAHIFLQACGIACAVAGTVLVCTSKGISGTAHGITGLVAAILAGLSLVTGFFALFGGQYLKLLHSSFGIPAFLLSTISLCTGLFTSDFKSWTNITVISLLLGLIIFYTIFILVTCFIKCMTRLTL